MEKISWTDHVRNEVLHRVKVERNVVKLHENVLFYLNMKLLQLVPTTYRLQ